MMTMSDIVIDENGYPIMLAARAPGQVAAQPTGSGVQIRRGAVSGNPNADPANGRFAGKKVTNAKLQQDITAPQSATTRSGIPQGVTVDQWNKRIDLVREAARSSDSMTAAQAKSFLKGNVADINSVDLDTFLADVRSQHIDDLVDIFDQQLRTKIENMEDSKQEVKVSAPSGYTKAIMNGLNDDEVFSLLVRMEGRGWKPADLETAVVSKITDKARADKLAQRYSERTKQGKKQPK